MKIIISENDGDTVWGSRGAIIHEQYTNTDEEEVKEKAKRIALNRNGRVWLAEVDLSNAVEVSGCDLEGKTPVSGLYYEMLKAEVAEIVGNNTPEEYTTIHKQKIKVLEEIRKLRDIKHPTRVLLNL